MAGDSYGVPGSLIVGTSLLSKDKDRHLQGYSRYCVACRLGFQFEVVCIAVKREAIAKLLQCGNLQRCGSRSLRITQIDHLLPDIVHDRAAARIGKVIAIHADAIDTDGV